MKYNLTIRIDADAGDVLIIPTLRLTPPQALRLAELLQEHAAAAQGPEPKTKPPSAQRPKPDQYNALLAAAWPPGQAGGARRRNRTPGPKHD